MVLFRKCKIQIQFDSVSPLYISHFINLFFIA